MVPSAMAVNLSYPDKQFAAPVLGTQQSIRGGSIKTRNVLPLNSIVRLLQVGFLYVTSPGRLQEVMELLGYGERS